MTTRIYTIVVEGELGPAFTSAFGGMTVTATDGATEIYGTVVDQTQLRAVLDRISDFGLNLTEIQSEEDTTG